MMQQPIKLPFITLLLLISFAYVLNRDVIFADDFNLLWIEFVLANSSSVAKS